MIQQILEVNLGKRQRGIMGSLAIFWTMLASFFLSPDVIMTLTQAGDRPKGLVGGIKTSTGGVPRHIQMCLHAFTCLFMMPTTYRR